MKVIRDQNWQQFRTMVEKNLIKRFGCQPYTKRGMNTLQEHWTLIKTNLDSSSQSEHQFQLGFHRRTMRHWNHPHTLASGYSFNDINNDVCFLSNF